MTFAISEAIAEAVVAPHGALGNNLGETGCGDHPAARTCGGDDVLAAVCPHRPASPYKTRPTYRFPTRILQRNLATVCLATDGDQLDLRPGENLGVDLPIMTEHLCDGALSRGVSAY